MFVYGKSAANAIAVLSYLAVVEGDHLVRSAEIAEARGISPVLAAKILTQLSAAQLIVGQPGPAGGYRLARPPKEINLFAIASLFEQVDGPSVCPFGPEWCGRGKPCALHDKLEHLREQHRRFLSETSLDVFCSPGLDNEKPALSGGKPQLPGKDVPSGRKGVTLTRKGGSSA